MEILHIENYKTFLRETEELLSKWEKSLVHGIENSILLRQHFSKNWSVYSLQPLLKSQWDAGKNWQAEAKIYMEMQRTWNIQNTLKNGKQS